MHCFAALLYRHMFNKNWEAGRWITIIALHSAEHQGISLFLLYIGGLSEVNTIIIFILWRAYLKLVLPNDHDSAIFAALQSLQIMNFFTSSYSNHGNFWSHEHGNFLIRPVVSSQLATEHGTPATRFMGLLSRSPSLGSLSHSLLLSWCVFFLYVLS